LAAPIFLGEQKMRYFWLSFFGIIAFALSLQVFANDVIYKARDQYDHPAFVYGSSHASACAALGTFPVNSYGDRVYVGYYGGIRCAANIVWHSGPNAGNTDYWVESTQSFVTSTNCEAEFGAGNTSFNVEAGICTPPCDGQINPVTNECDECLSSAWDAITGICLPDQCYGDSMPVYDSSNCVTTGGVSCGSGFISQCIQPSGTGCTDVLGKVTFGDSTGGDAYTFDYCNDQKSDCEAAGGTYGAAGVGSEMKHVCLVDYGDQLPTCASGSQYYIENQYIGGSGFACISAKPPADTCDASKFDCDGDGNVDDQDGDGVKDNGVANENGSGSFTPTDDPFEGPNVGEDAFDPAVVGAGDCDPTSQNYAECTGMNNGLVELKGTEGANVFSDINSATTATADGIETTVTDALGTGDAGIGGPTGIANDITGGIFNIQACSDLTFPIYGASLVIPCAKLQILRTILTWVVSVLTLIMVFNIATRRSPE
jgi:hypothetical protein